MLGVWGGSPITNENRGAALFTAFVKGARCCSLQIIRIRGKIGPE